MLRLKFAALAAFAIGTASLTAQTAVYGSFAAGHDQSAGAQSWSYGANAGVYKDFDTLPVLRYGFDIRGRFLTRSGSQAYSLMVGPRLAAQVRGLPLKPYVEGLIGAERRSNSGLHNSTVHPGFGSYGFAAGADVTLLPHIDWRIADFTYQKAMRGLASDQVIVSTGVVIRL